jgi:hypothetical protein
MEAGRRGLLTTTLQFNFGDAWVGEGTVDRGRPERWKMPANIADVLWVYDQMPFGLT